MMGSRRLRVVNDINGRHYRHHPHGHVLLVRRWS
jgi:hypothetical protein